jgi:His-Xaa-Ser repeat protein HxsA
MMIMRVQAALYSKGYNPGAIDGQLTEATKSALKKYQTARGLPATGTMTTETLSALGIALR